MRPRVAIVGAGVSGLASIKCCRDEGLEPVCYERTEDIGGVWRYQEAVSDLKASIYKSLLANISKTFMCFSDFPVPSDFPNYMSHSKLQEYLQLYADHFHLLGYICFQMDVQSVTRSHGRWEVTVRDSKGVVSMETYDAVMVCTGHHSVPYLPPPGTFPGLSQFQGPTLHTKEYKDPLPFEGLKVLVVGAGNSGSDVSVDISRSAERVFLSTRRGCWVFSRLGQDGFPMDLTLLTRYQSLLGSLLPRWLNAWRLERKLNRRFDHARYGLLPTYRVFSQYPVVNDELPHRILSGRVTVKGAVRRFSRTSAIFEDGSEEEVDAVVLATGYSPELPFRLEPPVSTAAGGGRLPAYRQVFPLVAPGDGARPQPGSLALIGLVEPVGPIMAVSEMQARWAARVFKGSTVLPPLDKMEADVRERNMKASKSWVGTDRPDLHVEYVPYTDGVADLIGVRPALGWRSLTDPRLAYQLLFGPCAPSHYRLDGPGKWPGARDAILTQWERVEEPLKARPGALAQKGASPLSLSLSLWLCLTAVLLSLWGLLLCP